MSEPMGLRAAAAARSEVMTERLRQLVEAESPSGASDALHRCADLLDRWFGEVLGGPARRPVPGHPHLLWAPPEPQVLLLGHFDTVWPLGTLAGWPFSVDPAGRASGPGVFDMKAGIVQLLTAVELSGHRDQISVLLTCDEETGSATSQALIVNQAVRAGTVVVCEPSADGGAVKVARKGIGSYRLTVTGRAAHAGLEPELGVNASVELAHQILALTDLADPGLGTSVTPTVLTAGTTTNTVPESADVQIDARSWTRGELDRVDTAIRALTPRLPGAVVRIDGGINRPPLEAAMATDLHTLTRAVAADIGLPPPDAVRSGGASDGNLTAAAAVPTLDGLGAVGGHPHARTEWVDTRAMADRAALLAALIDRIVIPPTAAG